MKMEVDCKALERLVRENERARAARAYAQENPYAPCKDILPILGVDEGQAEKTPEDDF